MISMMHSGDIYGVGADLVPPNACHSPVAMTTDGRFQSPDTYKGPISASSNDSPNSQLGSASTSRGLPKACLVCGDVAKSMHFGGLSCDSCKAFFRRSVQNNAFKGFSCPYDKQCIIAVSSRKACQYCRFQKCLLIGMEKNWVMPEDERKRMMQKRQERKIKQTHDDRTPDNSIYALNEEDSAEISLILSLYQKAYAEIPYDDCNNENDEISATVTTPGSASVLGPWMTFCKRIAYFFSLFKDFAELCCDDQFLLLKTAITSAGIIMGSVVYDGQTGKWSPRAMRSTCGANVPAVSIKNVEKIVPADLFCRVEKFFRKFQHICIDEKMAIILILISLYSPELMGLQAKDTVQVLQERYIHILDRYTKHVFREKSLIMFPKAIVSLADIRELADRTYQMHLKDRSGITSTNVFDERINHGAVNGNAYSSRSKHDNLTDPLSTEAATKRARLAATGDARDLIYQRIWQKVVDQMHISSMKLRAPSLLPFIIHIIKKLMRQEGIPERSISAPKRCLSSTQKIKRIGHKVRVLEVDPAERVVENLEIKKEIYDPEVYEFQHSFPSNSNQTGSEYWAQEPYSNSCSNDSVAYSTPLYSPPDFLQQIQVVAEPQICSQSFYSAPPIEECDTTVANFNEHVSPTSFSPMAPTTQSPEITQLSPVSPFSPPISSVQSQQSYLEGSSDMVYSPYSSSSSSSSPEDANLNFSNGLTDIEVDVLTELLECVTSIQTSHNVKEMFDNVNVKEILPLQLLTELKQKLCNGHDS